MILNRQFANEDFLKYDHRYEIFNSDEELICKGLIMFKQGSKGVNWNVIFNNYDCN